MFTCSEKHYIPCLAVLRRINRTHKDTKREGKTMQTLIHQTPPTGLGRTQPRGDSEARNSLLLSANLYMIEKKKSCAFSITQNWLLLCNGDLCASPLHRIRWQLAVHFSKCSNVFLLFNWVNLLVLYLSLTRYTVCCCGKIKAEWQKSFQ